MKENYQSLQYQTNDGLVFIHVNFQEETVWLSLQQLVILFERDKTVISRHIRNVFKEKELERGSVVAKFATTASDGKTYQVNTTANGIKPIAEQ